jgi:glycosyltransferase involved in cell wall biosynthesis
MAQVDCLVLPSYREGMPKCVLEANAMSLPVVTTDVPGCRNIVKHGLNGLICSPRDSSALAAVMTKMINMPSVDRNLMGQAGRKIVTNSYDERLVIQSAVDVVNNNILDLTV